MECKTCTQLINARADLFIVCDGRCSKSFHAGCVGLNENQVAVLSTKNILWLCDECMESYKIMLISPDPEPPQQEEQKEPKHTIVEDEINELKLQITDIKEALAAITIKPDLPTSSLQHSTPVKPNVLLSGTNSSEDFSIVNASLRTTPLESEVTTTFSLLLTNIDNSVSESEITQLAARCLGIPIPDCGNVRKLTPKWMDCRHLDYISFRITLRDEWKSTALTASTWPRGVKFREFIDRRNTTWKPN